MRLNVASIKNSSIPRSLGLCPTDPRLIEYLNEAQERMLVEGDWLGSRQVVQFCTVNSCLVLPREILNVEQVAVNGQPVPIYTQSYQFLQTLARIDNCGGGCGSSCASSGGGCGLGLIGPCGHVQMRDRGQAVSFAVTRGSNKKIRVYPASADDAGKTIIFQGRDSNNITVRSEIDGVVQNGEEVVLALPFVDTTTIWGPGNPVGVIKEATVDVVRVYSYNVDTTSEKLLAVYQPDETLPLYRSFNIPYFNNIPTSRCCVNDDGERIVKVTAYAKLAHIPVSLDLDWLLFQNLSAYKSAMMAVKFYEEQDVAKGSFYFYGTQAAPSNGRGPLRVINRNGAIPILQAELRSWGGDRTDANIMIEADNRVQANLANFV